MVKVLLFLGGLAILLVSSRQMFLMFSRWFISCSRQSADSTRRTPHNLLDKFSWARAFRRCRCRVDLLAIAYLTRLLDVRCDPDSDQVPQRSEMTRCKPDLQPQNGHLLGNLVCAGKPC